MMDKYKAKMPDGTTVFCPQGDADRHQAIIDARDKIVTEYCKKKGWPLDRTKISINQIMEIRATKEWKTAGGLIDD